MVINRLERAGLSDLVMDCHGGFKSRREFSRGLADAMQRIGSTLGTDYSVVHRDLSDRKQEMVGYAEVLHRQRGPWNISAFEVQAQLLEIPEEVRNVPRLPAEKVNALTVRLCANCSVTLSSGLTWRGPGSPSVIPAGPRSGRTPPNRCGVFWT